MKKTYLIISLLVGLLACSPASKESYFEEYEAFIKKVESGHKNYNSTDWKELDEDFDQLSGPYYEKFKDEFTWMEEAKIVKLRLKYNYFKNADNLNVFYEYFMKEEYEKIRDTIKYYYDNQMYEDIDRIALYAKKIGGEMAAKLDQIFAELDIELERIENVQRLNKVISIVTLAASVILFALGLWFPLLATKQQIIGIVLKYQETTLFGSVRIFFDEKEYFIASVIFLFTICLPILKFIELFNRLLSFVRIPAKLKQALHLLDKWSMLDVFLVALLLLNFKMDSNIIVMKLKIGTTFIALSIILRLVSSHFILLMDKGNNKAN